MDRMPCFELGDVGSIPAGPANAAIALVVERILGKDEVTGSNPVSSTRHASVA
jgi:hypothetical protein